MNLDFERVSFSAFLKIKHAFQLEQNSIEAHIWISLIWPIWLSRCQRPAIHHRIFDSDRLAPFRRGMSRRSNPGTNAELTTDVLAARHRSGSDGIGAGAAVATACGKQKA
ncbi:hypothetical protein [Mesorhizobium australicum]|uniref:hypothetical protein n=1 Tax=Mesorhizobium australicum TaxID=536018 RepID=UPI00111BDBAD|nr:hypothetical protein [Mesorhizobium australicum]